MAFTDHISMYIPASRSPIEVRNYLKSEIVESQNIKDKSNRKNVISTISRILE